MASAFKKTEQQTTYEGSLLTVYRGKFAHQDGETVEREWAGHPGAVAVVASDADDIYLASQPREAVGEFGLLEIPAGKLDVPGEPPLETAKRELAEEIGKGARKWESLGWFYISPGWSGERIELYFATDLYDSRQDAEENERIEVVTRPLSTLSSLITEITDAKSLIGLLRLLVRQTQSGLP